MGQAMGWAARPPSEAAGVSATPLALAHPLSSARSISNKELSELIEQLQKNADQVEKNIVDTEAKMQSVSVPPTLHLCTQWFFPGRGWILFLGNMWPHLETFVAVAVGVVGWTGIWWVLAMLTNPHRA